METAEVVREVRVLAGRLGLPGDDPEVLKDGYNLLVRLRLITPSGPVWNDFEDAWRAPVGWDAACANSHVPFWGELRTLYGVCWTRVRDLYRTRTLPRP